MSGGIGGGESGVPETLLDTKGQVHGFSTTNAAVNVGTDLQTIYADSTETLGIGYGASARSTLASTGDVLSCSAANVLAAISPATSGHVLTSNGATTLPSYQAASGAWSQIASSALSGAAASLTVTGMTKKKFLDINIAGGFASADIPAIQIGDGSINTSNYAWNVTQNGAASTTGTGSEIQCTNATTGSNFYIHAYLFNNSVDLNSFVGQTTSNNVSWTWTAYWNNSSQIDQLKLFGSDGGNNLSTPTQIVIYGAD